MCRPSVHLKKHRPERLAVRGSFSNKQHQQQDDDGHTIGWDGVDTNLPRVYTRLVKDGDLRETLEGTVLRTAARGLEENDALAKNQVPSLVSGPETLTPEQQKHYNFNQRVTKVGAPLRTKNTPQRTGRCRK